MNVSIAWQWGLKMCDVFFNPVSSTLNQCSWKHMYSSNIKNPWVEGVQEPGSCMHSIFSSTHDFNLANGPPVPNQRKFNILNHPCWLTVYAGLAEPHGDRVAGGSTRSVFNGDGMASHLEMRVIALNLAAKSKSFSNSSRICFYPDHCPNLLWHWKVFTTIK